MKVLVVGGGGREHAIVHALRGSERITELLCAPGNGGIAREAECVPIKATDIEGITAFVRERGIDFVVIAPEDPLALGLADELELMEVRAFGPRKNAAVLESSKAFSKEFMRKYGIPTALYQVFDDPDAARAYIEKQGAPIVVKADGLALGKGVVVAGTVEEAKAAVDSMMRDKKFGDSSSRVVVEEFMTGPEVTVLCFTDGKTLMPMLSSQDHKRALDGDLGENTCGMGAFCPSPRYTPEIADRCMQEIFLPTMEGMNSEGRTFKGVLYFGLMLTPSGPRVIEYNARFGDPETQAVLEMLDGDLLEIFEAVADERLGEIDIRWRPGSACCVVMASGGYPAGYETGYKIEGLDNVPEGVFVYHAGTRLENAGFYTSGGRVLGVTARGDSLEEAVKNAYEGVSPISFEEAYYRHDIGKR